LLSQALGRQHGVAGVTRKDVSEIDRAWLARFPAKAAEKYRSIPLGAAPGRPNLVRVAMLDPHQVTVLDELSFVLGARIEPVVAPERWILHLLERVYGIAPPERRFITLAQPVTERASTPAAGSASGRQAPVRGPLTPPPPPPTERHAPVRAPQPSYSGRDSWTNEYAPAPETRRGWQPNDDATAAVPAPETRRGWPPTPDAWEGVNPDRVDDAAAFRSPLGRANLEWNAVEPERSPLFAALEDESAYAVGDDGLPPGVTALNESEPPPTRNSALAPPLAAAAAAFPEAAAPAGPPPRSASPHADPVPHVDPMPGADSLETPESVLAAFAGATTRDEIGELLARYAAAAFGVGVVLVVKDGMGLGWRGLAPGVASELLESIVVPLSTPSMFRIAFDGSAPFRGPPPHEGSALHQRVWRLLHVEPPRDVIVAPVILSSRVVNLVYAQAAQGGYLSGTADAELMRACAAAAGAYRSLIQKKPKR
jgi:hypothetical protein